MTIRHALTALVPALAFLTAAATGQDERPPDPAAIEAQRAVAEAAIGDERYADAAEAWQTLRTMLPGAPEVPYNQALAVLAADGEGAAETARRLFGDALDRATVPAFRATIAFNLGVLAQSRGEVESLGEEATEDDRIAALEAAETSLVDALGWYREALADDAGQEDARVNGELSWRRLEEVRAALLGACCVCAETCVQVRKQACAQRGGVWQGLGSDCDACAVTGACCLVDGCEVLTEVCCRDREGEWLGADAACEQCFAPCCLPDETCESMTKLGCDAASGAWRQDGDCEQCTVACCLLDGTCETRWITECEAVGGYPVQDCAECATPSACCFEDGTCEMLTFADCAERGGLWLQLPARECDECDLGPCCLEDGTCERLSSGDCETQGGRWLGPLADCESCEQSDQQDQQDESEQDESEQDENEQDENQQDENEQDENQQDENERNENQQDENQQDENQQDESEQDESEQGQGQEQDADDRDQQDEPEQDPEQDPQSPDEQQDQESTGEASQRMTRSEALRLLQAVRDRERLRRELLEARERAKYEKPDKDW